VHQGIPGSLRCCRAGGVPAPTFAPLSARGRLLRSAPFGKARGGAQRLRVGVHNLEWGDRAFFELGRKQL